MINIYRFLLVALIVVCYGSAVLSDTYWGTALMGCLGTLGLMGYVVLEIS